MSTSDFPAIDLESKSDDDPRRRLTILSHQEISKVYKKGFNLLQKAGLKPGDSIEPPLRVTVRKAREGLKDDDLANRKGVGETTGGPKKSRGGPFGAQVTDSQSSVDELAKLLPEVTRYLEQRGGSASVSEVLSKAIRTKLPKVTQRGFLIAARLGILTPFGLNITENENSLILTKPPTGQADGSKPCACGRSQPSPHHWSRHVFNESWEGHEVYSKTLQDTIVKASCLVCLKRDINFPNMLSLVQHCRNSYEDVDHALFAEFIILKLLHESGDPVDQQMKTLLLDAVESCDKDFPWKSLGQNLADPDLSIPFPEGPPTPIYLSDSDQVSDPDSEVVEVVDLDSNFINLEE